MLELDQMKIELSGLSDALREGRDSLNLPYKRQRIEELSREMEAPDFWNDTDKANAKMKELKDAQKTVADADGLSAQYNDIMDLIEIGNEEEDASVVPDTERDAASSSAVSSALLNVTIISLALT